MYDPAMMETIKVRDGPLPLKYVEKPAVLSQKQLLLRRKKENVDQALEYKKILDEGTHKDAIVRLADREAARTELLRLRNQQLMKKRGLTQTKTQTQLHADRAAQTAMEVAVKADKPRVGIHPSVLPLYSQSVDVDGSPTGALAKAKSEDKLQSLQGQDRRRHWEFLPGYTAKPANASRIQMLQDRKFWARNDRLLLGDLTLEENPQTDSFKATHVPKPPPKEVAAKALTQNHFAPGAATKPPGTTKLRFSEAALRYAKIKGRLFDHVPKARDSEKDLEPLYSSFAANAEFRPPVSSKEVLQMKLLKR